MRIDLDVLENEICETQDGAVALAVGVAICERLEALTAAVERVGDGVPCQSCGADTGTSAHEATCSGCGDIVCQTCCDVWDHFGSGAHGNGNPHDEIVRLRAIETSHPREET